MLYRSEAARRAMTAGMIAGGVAVALASGAMLWVSWIDARMAAERDVAAPVAADLRRESDGLMRWGIVAALGLLIVLWGMWSAWKGSGRGAGGASPDAGRAARGDRLARKERKAS
jgi:hypothetical protein